MAANIKTIFHKFFNLFYYICMTLIGIGLIVLGVGLMLYGGFFHGYPFVLAGVLAIPILWKKLTHTDGKPWPKWLQTAGVVMLIIYGFGNGGY